MSGTTQKTIPQSVDNAADADLPEGWAHATLIDLAEHIQYGYTASAIESRRGPRFLRITDIQNGIVNWVSVPTCQISTTNLRKYRLQSGDILFARTGPTTGKSFLIRSFPNEAVFASYLIRVRPLTLVNPTFLSFCFQTPEYWQFISENIAGNAQPNCNATKLASLTLPIPPLAEQKRIVVKIEEFLSAVNAARDRLAEVTAILKRFRQSVLAAACSGRLTEGWRGDDGPDRDLSVGWRWLPMDQLLPKGGIFDGPFGSNLKTSDYTPSGVRVIRMENIGWLGFMASKLAFISEKKYQSLARHTVGAGDVIFSSFIGDEIRTCVLPALPTRAIAKADCFCLRPDPDLVDRHYLVLQLSSQESYDALRENIHGATRPRVNTTQVRRLLVRVCPIAEQHEIVRRVEALFKLADTIEKRVEAATKRADKLTQAILAKAFRGELVPTEAELARREGRTYEPASALLERIRREREAKAGDITKVNPRHKARKV